MPPTSDPTSTPPPADAGAQADAGPGPPVVRLEVWNGSWEPGDPHAGFKAEVAASRHVDPLVTLAGLSRDTGVPTGALARYVLVRWASGGSEALLELGTSGVDHLVTAVADAERVGTDEARLGAYAQMRELVGWLRAGAGEGGDPPMRSADEPEAESPGDGASAVGRPQLRE